MTTMVRTTTSRLSAEERRDAVLDAAVIEFALHGLHGTSTEAIAERAGISQPYVFRLFGTKKELFLAAIERVCNRILTGFRQAAAAQPECPLQAMGESFVQLLGHREELLVLLHGYAASADPEVQELSRKRFGEVYQFVEQVSGASDDQVRTFMAKGMLLMVAAAIDVPALCGKEEWADKCLAKDDACMD